MANEDAHRKQIKEEKKKMEYNMNILNNIMMGGGLYTVLSGVALETEARRED